MSKSLEEVTGLKVLKVMGVLFSPRRCRPCVLEAAPLHHVVLRYLKEANGWGEQSDRSLSSWR